MRVLAIDPGETTGVVVVEYQDRKVRVVHAEAAAVSAASAFAWLEGLDATFAPTVVVTEDYRVYRHRVRQHINSDLATPRLIGAIEAWCGWRKKPLRFQMASEAKAFFTDRRLRAMNLYLSNKHVRDALRHALHYLKFRGGANGAV